MHEKRAQVTRHMLSTRTTYTMPLVNKVGEKLLGSNLECDLRQARLSQSVCVPVCVCRCAKKINKKKCFVSSSECDGSENMWVCAHVNVCVWVCVSVCVCVCSTIEIVMVIRIPLVGSRGGLLWVPHLHPPFLFLSLSSLFHSVSLGGLGWRAYVLL